jgi:EmrB/QacA subfamily drug resistance transporter
MEDIVAPEAPPVAGPQSNAPTVEMSQADIKRIIIGVILAMLLGAIDQTIVATALPSIGNDLGDVVHLPWVVTAYLLSGTAVTPLYGKLADIIGRRRVVLTAIAIFVGASVLAALSRSMTLLIIARFLQGMGGGGLIALGQTVIGDVIAPRERGRYMVYFALVFMTASIAGPVLGGFLSEHLHWSFIFWINLPLGGIAFFITGDILKRLPRHERPHKIDWIGAILMVAATVTLMLALSWGGAAYPWGSREVIGTLVASAVLWVLFAGRLLTAPDPFVPLAIMFNPVVAFATASNFFIIGTSVALTIYLPIFFEAALHLTASESGLALMPFVAGSVVGAQLSGRAMQYFTHYKRTPVIGVAIAIAALAVLSFAAPHITMWPAEALLALVGISFGTIFPVTTVSVQNAVQPHQLGTTTATYNFFRSLGGAVLVATLGAVLIGGLGVGGEPIASLDQLVAASAAKGTAIAPVFRYVFATATVMLALGYIFLLAMKEMPLRGRAGSTR